MESDEPISEVIARVRAREVFTFDDLDSGRILRDAERLADEVERLRDDLERLDRWLEKCPAKALPT
jgi:hypothetical protein